MSFIPQYIHLGCGDHKLGYPWQNYDREVDLRERLPWGNETIRFIFAEHVIEHLTFLEGFRFLQEARRVLEPGGCLRFSFPDVTRFTPRHVQDFSFYLQKQGVEVDTLPQLYRALMTEWGHSSCWVRDMAGPVCIAAGFTRIWTPKYGHSLRKELVDVDGHHLTTGDLKMAKLETTIIEAAKGAINAAAAVAAKGDE